MLKALLFTICLLLSTYACSEEKVQIKTEDGKIIKGLLFGETDVALVLCHGKAYKKGAASFRKQCLFLEKQGLTCLALNFRGYPSTSKPQNISGRENDICAAVEYLVKQKKAKNVFVLGSSMGGFILLKALKQLQTYPAFSGCIILSAFSPKGQLNSTIPKMFVAAEDDHSYYPRTLKTFYKASGPKKMLAYTTGGHGQKLFESHGEKLLDEILIFIKNSITPPKDKK